MTVSSIRLIRKCLGTVSKALLITIAGNILRGASFPALKSSSIGSVMFVRSAVVWSGRKPSWEIFNGICSCFLGA